MKHLLLVGAGHAHVEVLRAFGRRPVPGMRLTVLTREARSPYSGMLPGVIAGIYDRADAEIDIAPLARFAGAELILDEACGFDPQLRQVMRLGGAPIGYDLVSLDIGSRPNTAGIAGAAEFAVPVKPIDRFYERFADVQARVVSGNSSRIVLVGGGAGGVELLLAVAARLRRDAPGRYLHFTLVTGVSGLLPGFPKGFRIRISRVMATRNIRIESGLRVTRVEQDGVILSDGRRIEACEILWTTEASPAAWLAENGLDCDAHGFLKVDTTLRAPGRDDIFAAGDMVKLLPTSVPHSGVYAVRAGPILAANLRTALSAETPRPWRPQRHALVILGTADGSAIATRGGLTLSGRWAWRLKNAIDRRFMQRFRCE